MKSLVTSLFFTLLLVSTSNAQGRRRVAWATNGTDNGIPGAGTLVTIPIVPEPNPRHANSQAENLVAVSQLHIPSKALKEFALSQKAFQKQDVRTSAEHLEKALHIYPDFVQAHNALGFRFLQLGDYQKALIEHQAAVALDPRTAQAHQNLGFTLLFLNRFKEAEQEARESIDLDPRPVLARYVLGRALIAQGRGTPEALASLEQSADVFANASLVLAQIHFAGGKTEQTIADLRHYLRAPEDTVNKRKAECWVAQLTNQPLPPACPADSTHPSFN